jgi:exodeoxyribonuclease VIII
LNNFTANTEGIFQGLPDEVYHNHRLAPEVNRGMVVTMLSTSPAHVRAMIDGLAVKETTPAMIVGSLVDKALLEPDRFKEGVSHWIIPEGLDLRTREGKAWRMDHPESIPEIPARTQSATIVSAQDIENMIASVMRHKVARRIIEQSIKQESAFARDKDTGLLRKCRPDAKLTDNGGRLVLADLKTTFIGGAFAETWSRHCARMSYHIQDAWYSDIYNDLTGEAPFFIFLVVERKPPYAVRVFKINNEGRQCAREKYKRALERFAHCKETGEWPAYPEEIELIQLPRWELE